MNRTTKGLWRLAVLGAVLLAGCEPVAPDRVEAKYSRSSVSRLLYVVDDTVRGVTCYQYVGYGVSCVPRASTGGGR